MENISISTISHRTKQQIIDDYGLEIWEKVKEYRKIIQERWRNKNIDYNSQWYNKNKSERLKQISEYRSTIDGRAKRLLNRYQRLDKVNNREIGDLTSDWIKENILLKPICHYCGKEIPYTEIGIDRKNSDLPHTKNNCVPCCKYCNASKKNKKYEDFKIIKENMNTDAKT